MPKDTIQIKDYNYLVVFSRQAQKDVKEIKENALKEKTEQILNLIAKNPFIYPPSYEKLTGKYYGMYSRRINIQHRIVYMVDESKKEIHILRMWTHYENINN